MGNPSPRRKVVGSPSHGLHPWWTQATAAEKAVAAAARAAPAAAPVRLDATGLAGAAEERNDLE